MKDEANIRVDVGTSGQITTNVEPKSKLEVIIGDAAKMDCQKAINYIKSGAAEIEQAVQEGIEDFNENAVSKTGDFNTNAVNKTNAFNQNAEVKTGDFNDNATDKTNAFNQNATDKTGDFNTNAVNKTKDFNDNAAIKQAAVDASAAAAANSANLAKQWAIGDPTEPTGNSAKYWAGQAHAELSDLQSDVSAIQANYVTTNTVQTITGSKTFNPVVSLNGGISNIGNASEYKVQVYKTGAGAFAIAMNKQDNSSWMSSIVFEKTGEIKIEPSTYIKGKTPTEDTTSSTQIDTVGARNTKLANYVTTNTNQNITSEKTIKRSNPKLIYINTDMTRGTTPASNLNHSIVRWADNSNTVMGYIRTFYSTDGYWGMGFQLTEGSTYPEILIAMNSSGSVYTKAPTPTEDTTASTQIDTVGARNTKLGSMFQVVASLPATPDADTFYFIEES